MVWFPGFAYESLESCRADWCAGDGEIADVPAEVEIPSVDVPDREEHDLLLAKDAD